MKHALIVLLLIMSAPTFAKKAETKPYDISLSFGGGYNGLPSYYKNDAVKASGNRINAVFYGSFSGAIKSIYLGAYYSQAKLSFDRIHGINTVGGINIASPAHFAGITAKYNLDFGRLRPFAGINVGYYFTSSNAEETALVKNLYKQRGICYGLDLGVKYRLTPVLYANVMLSAMYDRQMAVYYPNENKWYSGDERNYSLLRYTLLAGLSFKF